MSALSDGENNTIVWFARLVFRRPAIGMIVGFCVGDMPRRLRRQLNMMYAMRRREDQEE